MEWSIVYVRFFNLINSKGGHSSANRIFLASLQRKNLSVNLAILIWSQYKEWKEADCSSFEVLLLYVFVLSVNNIFLRVFHLGLSLPKHSRRAATASVSQGLLTLSHLSACSSRRLQQELVKEHNFLLLPRHKRWPSFHLELFQLQGTCSMGMNIHRWDTQHWLQRQSVCFWQNKVHTYFWVLLAQ